MSSYPLSCDSKRFSLEGRPARETRERLISLNFFNFDGIHILRDPTSLIKISESAERLSAPSAQNFIHGKSTSPFADSKLRCERAGGVAA
jgi:hypothetical protein